VLVPVQRLLRRIRQVPSRADELIALRRRVRREDPRPASDEERTLAHEIRALKLRISKALGSVTSCSSCAPRKPLTAFAGGDCCGGVTAELFSEDELAALVLAGTRSRHLRAPRGEHGGCAFRDVTGCTLATEHRPARCVLYTCNILQRELHARGDLTSTELLLAELKRSMERFAALRNTRLNDEQFSRLEVAVLSARD
jgi:hypothetical protein